MAHTNTTVIKVICKLCGHIWLPRIAEPMCCPKCKRYDYNKPMQRKQYQTIAIAPDGMQSEFTDWAANEADLFDQYDVMLSGWKLVSKNANTYTISFEKIR